MYASMLAFSMFIALVPLSVGVLTVFSVVADAPGHHQRAHMLQDLLVTIFPPVAQSAVRQAIREVRTGVSELEGGDIGLRLLELGFVEGESLRVVAHGYPGREPLAVRIGSTTFALRRF